MNIIDFLVWPLNWKMKICSAWFNVIFLFFFLQLAVGFFPSYKLRRQNPSNGSPQLESHLSALTFKFVTLLHTKYPFQIWDLLSVLLLLILFPSDLLFSSILKNENVLQHSVFLELKSITTFSDIKDHTFNQIISFKLPPMTSPAFPQYLLITV